MKGLTTWQLTVNFFIYALIIGNYKNIKIFYKIFNVYLIIGWLYNYIKIFDRIDRLKDNFSDEVSTGINIFSK